MSIITHLGCSENNQHSALWFMNFSCVLPTSHKGYYTERPIESAVNELMHAGACNILQSQSIFLEPLYTLKVQDFLSPLFINISWLFQLLTPWQRHIKRQLRCDQLSPWTWCLHSIVCPFHVFLQTFQWWQRINLWLCSLSYSATDK